IAFDSSGIVLEKQLNGVGCQFNCRIFSDTMAEYYLEKNIALILDQKTLLKILKTFKPKININFMIYKNSEVNDLFIQSIDSEKNIERIYSIRYKKSDYDLVGSNID